MNQRLKAFREAVRSRKTAVMGMDDGNMPLITYLLEAGADVTVFDPASPEALKERMERYSSYSSIHYSLGRDCLTGLTGFDRIFTVPGTQKHIRELPQIRNQNVEITTEADVFFDLCPAELFAITGSDGKSTTAVILHRLLTESGYSCYLGGTSGKPLLGLLDHLTDQDKVVLELNNFQLHTMTRSPHVAVITNLSPNHLDYHGSMMDYVEAKKSIYKYQGGQDRLILNDDNELTRELGAQAPSKVTFFSRRHLLKNGFVCQNGKLCHLSDGETEELIEREQIKLPGDHNLENYLAAIAAGWGYITPEAIRKTASSLESIPNHMELVRELDGVRYYNDSAASSPTRTMATLNAFDQRVILIAGGYDKKIPYAPMAETLINHAKHVILLGQTASIIEMALMKSLKGRHAYTDIRITHCHDLEQAVYSGYFSAKPGDVVLLSPASAMTDQARSNDEKGHLFREIVSKLPSRKA